MSIPQYKRTRIKRILHPGNWPLRHFTKDGVMDWFKPEYEELLAIKRRIENKAERLGVILEPETSARRSEE